MTSGCIESIVIAGRRFVADSESSATVQYPGTTNEIKVNGDGSTRIVKSRHTGKIEGLDLVVSNDRDDHEFLQKCQDSLEFLEISATEVDGTVVGGEMQLTESLGLDTKEGIIPITLEGNCYRVG